MSEKRIFLCAERFFPRGDAGANRVLFIAKALKNRGWDVMVLSIGKNDPEHYREGRYFYEGIPYENIVCKTSGILQKAERRLLNGRKTVSLLKKHGFRSTDKGYIYASTAAYTRAVLKYAQKCGVSVAADVVEWHQPFQFRFGTLDPWYRSFRKCFDHLFPEAKNVIAISRLLQEHFFEKGCNVLKLPIYIEVREAFRYAPKDEILHLIYPGNPYKKDSLETMLSALAALGGEEKRRVCLHLTGASRKLLERSVPGKESLLDLPCVRIHEWMEYRELTELYQYMDFALIVREDTVITRANFPSKVPELMDCGIPVIINPVGDIREYLKPGKNAVLLRDSSVNGCTSVIRQCLQMDRDEMERMHKAAFESAAELFDYRQCEKSLDDFFSNLK